MPRERKSSIGLQSDTKVRQLGLIFGPQGDTSEDDGGGGTVGPPPCGTATDYWVTTDVQLNDAILAAQAADPGNDFFFLEIMNSLGAFDSWEIGAACPIDGDTVQWHIILNAGYTYYFNEVDTSWHKIEFHGSYNFAEQTTSPELFIDDTSLGLVTNYALSYDPSEAPDKYVFFGGDIADENDGDLVKFRNMKIGTERGLSNIWDGSSLEDSVVPPFDGIWGTDAATALSAAGGILSAESNWNIHPHGNCYAYTRLCA